MKLKITNHGMGYLFAARKDPQIGPVADLQRRLASGSTRIYDASELTALNYRQLVQAMREKMPGWMGKDMPPTRASCVDPDTGRPISVAELQDLATLAEESK